MLDEDILMLMLTCGFGVGVTPMIWSEVGDAMNRTVNLRTRIKTLTYVDDFLGGGKQDHVRHAASAVHEIIRGVLVGFYVNLPYCVLCADSYENG